MKIVWFSEIKWSYLRTRKQQLILNFPPDWEVLFVENFVFGKKNRYRPGKSGRVVHATIPYFKGTHVSLINRVQNWKPVQGIMTLIASIWVKWLLRTTGFSEPNVVFVSNVFFIELAKKLNRPLIYDYNDDPMGFSEALPFVRKYFEKTVRGADVVVTVSEKMHRDILQLRSQRTFVIGNAVDFDLFQKRLDGSRPADIAEIPHPIVFFSGALADWIDLDLVTRIAGSFPEASVVLVGPILPGSTESKIQEFTALKNGYWLGEKRHEDLPLYIRESKVCMLPFKMNKRTIGCNPNTFYEFLACSKPVVTLDYSEEIRRYSDIVHVAKDQDEFVDAIGRALSGKPDGERLKQIAVENSWVRKSEQVVEIVTECMTRSKKAVERLNETRSE